MAFFDWQANYSVGIQKIDDQHKELVRHLNNLYEAMHAGKGKDALDTVMTGMVRYTREHFITEESLMRDHQYPGYDAHRKKHQRMTARVLELKAEFDAGQLSNPLQMVNFLKDWLGKHILETDMAYGPYLNEKGVR